MFDVPEARSNDESFLQKIFCMKDGKYIPCSINGFQFAEIEFIRITKRRKDNVNSFQREVVSSLFHLIT